MFSAAVGEILKVVHLCSRSSMDVYDQSKQPSKSQPLRHSGLVKKNYDWRITQIKDRKMWLYAAN
jgi:hypothetical protein